MNELLNTLVEALEDREAILIKHINLDKGYFNDAELGQFYRGRVAIEESWLEYIRKLLKIVKG